MKKLIALILIVGLLVVTGCNTTTDDSSDTTPPPALPDEKIDKSTESLEDNNLQPPKLPEE